MAYDPSYDTDDSAVPAAVREFFKKRLFELAGVILFIILIAVGLALATWSVEDPSLNRALDQPAKNWLGYPGAVVADQLMQFFGLGVLPFIIIPMGWALRSLSHRTISRPFGTVFYWLASVLAASAALAAVPVPAKWALVAGLGGNAGDIIHNLLLMILSVAVKGPVAQLIAGLFALVGTLVLVRRANGSRIVKRASKSEPEYVSDRRSAADVGRDAVAGLVGGIQHILLRWRERRAQRAAAEQYSEDEDDIIRRLAPTPPPMKSGPVKESARIEPMLAPAFRRGGMATEELEDEDGLEQDLYGAGYAEDDTELADEEDDGTLESRPTKVSRSSKPIKQSKRLKTNVAPEFRFEEGADYELPDLTLLAEPKRAGKAADLSDDVLEQNARMLEGVLEDFGVKGQIIKVRPGPVVTLYELEPAPGIKSSRVISLADDIARSMSAISARVAVVQGRNAIGIELPNAKRETVYLRELLGSEAFEKSSLNLALALGKNIGGEPVFADLARMPHLLIAGTTGSGKSVGINTMILSLLYRLPPDRCKLIMIDPKMLELSIYEGIPHLLSPVVTDPRKAVVALKWAVREMEERYRKMSKMGVRNIDGYNTRMRQAQAKGEKISRTIQTGFDPETGEPVFEKEQMDLAPMPYIVVIIDEMADLMMVAGKDIEGAVQRLAQMARAAGIHVVMATQRPSVDVITGTIKANFPTRISFQVTSKIDSRTILGEQGAEQLLGQGDMLYMAGGGRISRLHAPFVADDEVEKIVAHLKEQGAPEYVDAVTEEADDGGYGDAGSSSSGEGGGSGDDLYDQAVAVILRDKKVSTSYVQRRLQIGYNKAASLIERMEKEGLISAANATGKREILVPGDSANV